VTAVAAKHRLPAVFPEPEFAAAGGLMAHGTKYSDMYRRAAVFVVVYLKPADNSPA
jgi:putative ABC transport system substrate-binding protein